MWWQRAQEAPPLDGLNSRIKHLVDKKSTGDFLSRMVENLHSYYAKQATQNIFASYRNLSTEAELANHVKWRETLYSEMLGLPPLFFRGLHIGEFGPDTGENAICFARWGARLTLAEPNHASHPTILEYFGRFGVREQLLALDDSTLETYEPTIPFDFINAEGFVGAIRPADHWFNAMDRLLASHGLFLVSYFERSGAWMEQAVSALAHLVATRGGMTLPLAAEAVMEAKWKQVAHTRSFEAWSMDVIQNPFSRQAFQFNADELLAAAATHGFRLHTSVPQYRDPLWIGWYKRPMSASEYLERASAFIRRSRMGYLLGHGCLWLGQLEALGPVERLISDSLVLLDQMIGSPETTDGRALADGVLALRGALLGNQSLWLADGSIKESATGLEKLAKCFISAANGDLEAVKTFSHTNRWFMRNWGTPVHFAVFRREHIDI
jgi:hypothetical protein